MSKTRGSIPSFLELATSNGIRRRSLATGVVVGSILTAINQGDLILAGESPNILKIMLNFMVPYCVATYGAVSAKRADMRDREE